jgi:hypothetical protein
MRRGLLFGVLLTVVLAAAPAAWGDNVIFNAFVKPKPANLPSHAFEATSTKQFGDEITFGGTNRTLKAVRVTLSSWGCQTGHWFSNNCHSAHGATFSVPITLNIYSPPLTGFGTGSLLATKTQTFQVKYRPSASPRCGDGRWYRSGSCFNGLAVNVKFDLASLEVTLPNTIVYGLSFNTTHYGPAPIGEGAACFSSSGGCPYDSLNVGLASAVTVGSKPFPNTVYLDSSVAPFYCDSGTAGVGTFRLDSPSNPCWTGFVPAVRFTASRN